MNEKDNYLKNAELATEQNHNMIDGVLNNMLLVQQANPEEKPKDRMKEPPPKKQIRDREDR